VWGIIGAKDLKALRARLEIEIANYFYVHCCTIRDCTDGFKLTEPKWWYKLIKQKSGTISYCSSSGNGLPSSLFSLFRLNV
jgi:hypothetical protein